MSLRKCFARPQGGRFHSRRGGGATTSASSWVGWALAVGVGREGFAHAASTGGRGFQGSTAGGVGALLPLSAGLREAPALMAHLSVDRGRRRWNSGSVRIAALLLAVCAAWLAVAAPAEAHMLTVAKGRAAVARFVKSTASVLGGKYRLRPCRRVNQHQIRCDYELTGPRGMGCTGTGIARLANPTSRRVVARSTPLLCA